MTSHPAGVRGLKPDYDGCARLAIPVAPRRGAWIETIGAHPLCGHLQRRTPQGCVD